jgi:hypothetical protein
MHAAAIDWAVDGTLRSLAGGTSPSAAVVMFLLRVYTLDGRENVRGALEDALARGLELVNGEPHPAERCEWLRVFDQAATLSSDERLAETLQSSLARAVEGLERLVGSKYEPGEGLYGEGLGEHLRQALALLAAFEMTGRLPYSMLAEELAEVIRRRWWDGERATFGDDFESDCRATQLFCRLAALHEDESYGQMVNLAGQVPYRVDAERLVASIESQYRDQRHETAAVALGLALVDWLALDDKLH